MNTQKVLPNGVFVLLLGLFASTPLCHGQNCLEPFMTVDQDAHGATITYSPLIPETLAEFYNDYMAGEVLAAGTTEIDFLNGVDCATMPNILDETICDALNSAMPIQLEEPISDCLGLNPDCDCDDDDCNPNVLAQSEFIPFLGVFIDIVALGEFTQLVLGEMTAQWSSRPALEMQVTIPDNTSVAEFIVAASAGSLDGLLGAMISAGLANDVNGSHEVLLSGTTVTIWLDLDHSDLYLSGSVEVDVNIGSIEFTNMAEAWQDFILENFLSMSAIESKVASRLEDALDGLVNPLVGVIGACMRETRQDGHFVITGIAMVDDALEITLGPADEDLEIDVDRVSFDTAWNLATFESTTTYSGYYDFDDFDPTVSLWRQDKNCVGRGCLWREVATSGSITQVDHGVSSIEVEIPRDDYLYRVDFFADPDEAGVHDDELLNNEANKYLSWDPDYSFTKDQRESVTAEGRRFGGNLILTVSGTIYNLGLIEDPNGVELAAHIGWDPNPTVITTVATAGMGVFTGAAHFSFSVNMGRITVGNPIAIRLVLDPDDLVVETFETNNEISLVYSNDTFETTIRDILSAYDLQEFDPRVNHELLYYDWVRLFDDIPIWEPDVTVESFVTVEELEQVLDQIHDAIGNTPVENLRMVITGAGDLVIFDQTSGARLQQTALVTQTVVAMP